MPGCKGICERFRTGRNPNGSRYGNGKVRCNTCELFIKHDGIFCPCCGMRLKTKPKNKLYKLKLRNRQK